MTFVIVDNDERKPSHSVSDSGADVRGEELQISFCCGNSFLGLRVADKRNVIKRIVSFTAPSIKESEGACPFGIKMLLSKFNDGYMMSEVDPGCWPWLNIRAIEAFSMAS